MDNPNRKLIPQNYILVNILSIIALILVFIAYFIPHVKFLLLPAILLALIQQYSFLTYLKNFNSEKAIYWQKSSLLLIALSVPFFVIWSFIFHYIKGNAGALIFDTAFKEGFLLSNFIFCAILGYHLQKIPDDFIGLLKELGRFYLYWVVGCIILDSSMVLSKEITQSPIIRFLGTAYGFTPTIVIIIIYYRANKYKRALQNDAMHEDIHEPPLV